MSEMPRILFVADLNVYAKGHARLRALKRLGAEIKAFSHTAIGGDDKGHPDFSLAFRLAWKLGWHLDTERINRALPATALDFKPDLIWIEKGNMVRPATLAALKRSLPDVVIAAYSEDDMFHSLNRTRAFTQGLRHYDVVFTTKSYNADPGELPALGARRCVMVDKAYDPDQHFPIDVTDADIAAYGADVGFIGTYAPERGRDVARLAEAGLKVRVWGNGWQAFSGDHANLAVERRALVNTESDLAYTKGIAATRINLGFLRKENRDLQTDRSIEIPASGGFMLAELSDEHARLFDDGKEAAFYSSPDEMVAKARYFLEHDAERAAIAAAGRARCLSDGYSHDERMRFMLARAMEHAP
jgi:spore maturation protein CgeB